MRKKTFNVSNLKQFNKKAIKNYSNVANIVMNKSNLNNSQFSNTLFDKIEISHVNQLKELIMSVSIKPHITKRLLSALTFCILRTNKISYKSTKILLESFGLNDIRTATNWINILIESDDPLVMLEENRTNTTDDFYQLFPDVEAEAKVFARERMQDKAGNFKAKELEDFINGKFEEASGEKLAEGVTIRAESSCRRDLLKWGAKYEINKKRPYFHGHERPDVIEYRNEFVKKFDITKKSFGFLQKFIDEESYLEPSIVRIENEKRCVVMCHDESTFRSGESAPSRWVWNNEYTFFNKGYGQSLMVSDFLVLDSEPYFELNESEYKLALKKYPDLNNDTFYKKNSASLFMEPGIARDGYVDNQVILQQFERLFKLFQFKKRYKDKHLIIIVDNATTHTCKEYTISDFSMKSGTKCPTQTIHWTENGEDIVHECFFDNGISKGLLVLGQELGLLESGRKYKLKELREIVGNHAAFRNKTNLEVLAEKYKVEIVFSPKFHCELNPIEGLWCFQKVYIRKNTDGSFEKMVELMNKTRDIFKEKGINLKLWNRFFNTVKDYSNNLTYEEILKKYYGTNIKTNILSHRKICSI